MEDFYLYLGENLVEDSLNLFLSCWYGEYQ